MISLSIKVKPGSFKDEIIIDKDGALLIKIKEKPIDGNANSYLIKFLAKVFNTNKSGVIIEKGLASPYKKVLINIDLPNYERALNQYKK